MSILLSMKNFLLPTEFMEWKDEYEKNSKSWFIKATGAKVRGEATLTCYYCNRSGYFHSQSAEKRRLKSQGSSKINTHCTAATHILLLQALHFLRQSRWSLLSWFPAALYSWYVR